MWMCYVDDVTVATATVICHQPVEIKISLLLHTQRYIQAFNCNSTETAKYQTKYLAGVNTDEGIMLD